MKYQQIDNLLFVRIDRGEELLEALKTACLSAGVKLGAVSGIGATDDFTVGVYDTDRRVYAPLSFTGAHEIVALVGNITTMNGEYYAHLHMSAADSTGRVVGGHLNRAVISATCELTVATANGSVERFRDEESGLNLWKL